MAHKSWFGPRGRGVGISPVSVEGWISLIIFIAFFVAGVHLASAPGTQAVGVITIILATLIFSIVAFTHYKKE